MSNSQRIRRKNPDRDAPIRNWSNMFQGPAATGASAPNGNGAASERLSDESIDDGMAIGASSGSAIANDPVSEEARAGVEIAYRVIDEHLQEGRRAAQARIDDAYATAAGGSKMAAADPAGMKIATDSLQEMITQGVRFYSSLAPLWANFLNSVAVSAGALSPAQAGAPAAPLAPAPIPRSTPAMGGAPIIIEIVSARMARVTIDLAPQAIVANLATTGLYALESDRPPIREVTFKMDELSNRPIVRIRVTEDQTAGVYNGVIVDKDSGDARGTITVRIEG